MQFLLHMYSASLKKILFCQWWMH